MTILKGYEIIFEVGSFFIVNPNIRAVYKNLPWAWINNKQKRISKKAEKNLDKSGIKDLG
jgi:hypothetical protein